MSDQLYIYGHLGSQPVRSVVIFAKLSLIPYEFKTISLVEGDQNTEEFSKINPFKAIPAIVHGSYNLWESAAIVTYLSEAFDTDNQWYPKDLKIRARINAYLHWHHQNTREIVATYVRDKYIFPRFFGAPQISESKESELYKTWLILFYKVLQTIISI